MIYPENIEEKLGFDELRGRLNDLCRSELGRKMVAKMRFSGDQSLVIDWLKQVDEFKSIIERGELPDLEGMEDLSPFLQQSKISGTFLTSEAFAIIRATLLAYSELTSYLNTNSDDFPVLANLVHSELQLEPLIQAINLVIGEKGEVLDRASPELRTIRSEKDKEEKRLRGVINSSFSKAQKDGFVPDGSTITVRDGRLVIPITASNKRQIKGFIHDESASGHIVYLEPAEALEANNRIKELYYSEQREITRILTQLTDKFREYKQPVTGALAFLSIADFVWAKAHLAIILKANLPEISDDDRIEVVDGKHPQLIKAFQGTARQVVPQNIYLDKSSRIVLISGPNAGGKSVALKTFGVNQYMLQCGLLPCVGEASKMRFFKSIFIDIGDEQSIDNDLSTYSSHLQNMRMVLKNADPASLILIDEFGTGTDPQFGAAIAESMLERFIDLGCYGMITTHYGNLKSFAEKHEGCINAAMKFDMVNLEPKYELEIGRPGSSFALEIAQKTGVHGEVIRRAKEIVGFDQISTEKLLSKLERQKQTLDSKSKEMKAREKQVAKLEEELAKEKTELKNKKQEILNSAKSEAADLLSQTNKEIERTIRHIKENKAQKQETNKVRKKLESFSKSVKPEKTRNIEKTHQALEGPLKPGDFAIINSSGMLVEVEEVKGKSAKILMGELKSVAKLKDLTKVSNKAAKKQNRARSRNTYDMNRKMADYSTVLDVRGRRADEVITEIGQFLDHALMLNQTHLKVIHGKGTGALRDVVRQTLREYDFVAQVSDEHIERGGDGATLITLK